MLCFDINEIEKCQSHFTLSLLSYLLHTLKEHVEGETHAITIPIVTIPTAPYWPCPRDPNMQRS